MVKKNSAQNLQGSTTSGSGFNYAQPQVMLEETSINAYTSIHELGCSPHTNFEVNDSQLTNHQNISGEDDHNLKIFLASLGKVLKVGSTEMKV